MAGSNPSDDQAATIAFLSRPDSYGITGPVERIDTHAAIVFLAGERAYKLKRAVRYSFLDFSTLARRRAVCEAELTLNRRTAPELYLELRSVNRQADGTVGFGAGRCATGSSSCSGSGAATCSRPWPRAAISTPAWSASSQTPSPRSPTGPE